MQPKDLLPIIFERSNASTALWNIEFVVILGVLTFMATGKQHTQNWTIKICLSLLFCGAQFFNARGLIEVSYHRKILNNLFKAIKTEEDVVNPFTRDCYIIDPLRYSTIHEIIGIFGIATLIGTLLILFFDTLPI